MERDSFLTRIPVIQQLTGFLGEVEALARKAFVSPLTELLNKRALKEAGAIYDRELKVELVVAFLDLSGFKRVNDEHGHAVGDLVLARFGAELSALTRGKVAYPTMAATSSSFSSDLLSPLNCSRP